MPVAVGGNQSLAAATTFSPAPNAGFGVGDVRYLDNSLSDYALSPMLSLGVGEAFSENGPTAWNGSVNDTVVIRHDLGDARGADFYICSGLAGANSFYRPIAAHLEYSDDDSAWSTVENFTGLGDGGQPGLQNWLIRWDTAAAGTHRYWRVTLTHGGTWLFVDRTLLGGNVVSFGRAITFSDAPFGSFPARVADVLEPGDSDYRNDVSNGIMWGRRGRADETSQGQYAGWVASTGATRSATVDLGSALGADYVYITGYYGTELVQRPSAIHIEFSDDNSAWTTHENKTGLSAGGQPGARKWLVRSLIAGETHRYWRFTFTVVADWLFLGSIDFTSGWVNHAIGQPYTVTPGANAAIPDAQPATLLVGADWEAATGGKLTNFEVGNWAVVGTATGWQLNTAATGTARFDLGSDFGGDHAVFYGQHGPTSGMRTPASVTIEYSDDDSNWTPVLSKTGLTKTQSSKARWVAVADVSSAGAHRYWRGVISTDVNDLFYAFTQFELWAQTATPPAGVTGTGAATLADTTSAGTGVFTGVTPPPSGGGNRMGGNKAIRRSPTTTRTTR